MIYDVLAIPSGKCLNARRRGQVKRRRNDQYAGSALGRALCVIALSLGLAASAAAQSVSGTILGTVTDSTGATVAGAKVTIVNEGTGLTRVLTADSNGEYRAGPSDRALHHHFRNDRVQDRRARRTSKSASTSASVSISSMKSAR